MFQDVHGIVRNIPTNIPNLLLFSFNSTQKSFGAPVPETLKPTLTRTRGKRNYHVPFHKTSRAQNKVSACSSSDLKNRSNY